MNWVGISINAFLKGIAIISFYIDPMWWFRNHGDPWASNQTVNYP